ncbi:hypothetical protein CDAR_258641 [Caerostris darwini]|uniref:Uncharacterized protein n=1 Tax=Caerostris darwini TaxID=1538125 RepID=A0AAV4NIY7_9ARAC|nr:hypothetical protein CDAR_258641 [Caerostris darwini]
MLFPNKGASFRATHAVPLCIPTSISIWEEDVTVIVNLLKSPPHNVSPTPPQQSLPVALTGNESPPSPLPDGIFARNVVISFLRDVKEIPPGRNSVAASAPSSKSLSRIGKAVQSRGIQISYAHARR